MLLLFLFEKGSLRHNNNVFDSTDIIFYVPLFFPAQHARCESQYRWYQMFVSLNRSRCRHWMCHEWSNRRMMCDGIHERWTWWYRFINTARCAIDRGIRLDVPFGLAQWKSTYSFYDLCDIVDFVKLRYRNSIPVTQHFDEAFSQCDDLSSQIHRSMTKCNLSDK